MIGLLIVITLGVYFGIVLANQDPDQPKPFVVDCLTRFAIGFMIVVVGCCLLIGYVAFTMPDASGAGLPGFAQQDWSPPGWETPTRLPDPPKSRFRKSIAIPRPIKQETDK